VIYIFLLAKLNKNLHIFANIYIYQISDSNNLVCHVITQGAENQKDRKVVEKSQEKKEIAYMNCDQMVALIAISWTNDSSYVPINTIKI